MLKKTVFPAGHWSLQVDIPYSMELACGDLIFLCGQADLEGDGKVCNASKKWPVRRRSYYCRRDVH
jgi:hypothetical protein